MNKIKVHNLSKLPTAPIESFKELQDDFKLYDSAKNSKLQMLIITRGFKYAFKAWKDKSGTLWIIDAHQRKKALANLKEAGFVVPDIPYELIFAKDKKEAVEEIAAYNSEFGTKNPDTKLFEKYDIDLDTLSRFSLGFESMELNMDEQRLEMQRDLGIIVEDDVPGLDEKKPLSEFEDLWLLGGHRLYCGDSTNAEHVLALMDGKKADLATTDPPYNVDYKGVSVKTKITNDSMGDHQFREFLNKVFFNIHQVMKEGASIYVFHSDSESVNFRLAFQAAGFYLSQTCIWVKNNSAFGRNDYHYQHEPILYGWKQGESHKWNSDRKQTTLWSFDKPQKSELHPTMKPVKLMAYTIENNSKVGELVVDLFGGSGSTLIAGDQLDRRCYLMELAPLYIDVIIRRYHNQNPEEKIIRIRNGERKEIDNI